MAKSVDYPMTPAVRVLRAAGVAFSPLFYDYVEHGGTRVAAEALGLEEHAVIKTLVMQTDAKRPLVVLMHGDREVAVGLLAKAIGAKSVAPCDPKTAEKITGYQVGGTSPFGLRTPGVTVYAERTILSLPQLTINAGKRGFLVAITPDVLTTVLNVQPVDAAMPGR